MIAARWLARALALTPLVIGWFFLIGEAAADPGRPEPEGVGVALMLIALTLVVILAWFEEGIGGAALIAIAVAFGVFVYLTSGHNRALAAGILPSPWLAAGLLFLAVRLLAPQREGG